MEFVRRILLVLLVAVLGTGSVEAQYDYSQYYYAPPYGEGVSPYTTFPTLQQAISATEAGFTAQNPGACPPQSFQVVITDPYIRNTWGNEAGYIWTCQPSMSGPLMIPESLYQYDPGKTLGNGCNCDGGEGQASGDSGNMQSGNGSIMAGDPGNAATGNKFQQDDDYPDADWLTFRRFYNSGTATYPAAMGAQWRHSFDRSMVFQSYTTGAATILMLRPDGKWVTFNNVNGVWTSDPGVADILIENDNAQGAATSYTFFVAAQKHFETYNTNGVLQSVVDEAGQGVTLSYSSASTPSNVAPSPNLLLSVTDPKGRQLQFAYNSAGNVATVTLPDGGTLAYAYDSVGNLQSVTYPDGKIRQYVYGELANTDETSFPSALTGIVDEAGVRYETTTYDENESVTSTSYPNYIGKMYITYDPSYENTAGISGPLGSYTVVGFNETNGAMKVASSSASCGPLCGQPWQSMAYDTNDYPTNYVDFNGNITATTYDATGLLDQEIDAKGTSAQRTITTTWNTTLRLPLTRNTSNASGVVVDSTQWVYNNLGQTLAHCDIDPTNSAASGYSCSNSGIVPAGVRRWTYTYCTAVDTVRCPLVGLMLTAIGPRTDLTQTTTYSYYMMANAVSCGVPGAACYQPGDLHTITDALGHVTTIASYDADGRITRVVDANGVNTDMTYTPRGFLSTRTIGGATSTFTYTAYGAVQTITDPDGVMTTYGYDNAHRLVQVTDALGNYIEYTLDYAGDKTGEKVYDVNGYLHKSLTREFNQLGQLEYVVDGLNNTIFNASNSGSYDANGNLTQSSDGLGIQRQLSYDALNRLVQTIDNYNGADAATQNTTSAFQYDSLDHLIQLTDPNSLSTNYSFDGLSDPTGQVSPDTGTTGRSFDAAGNVLTSTDAKGIAATNTYDAKDRLISTSYPDSSQNVSYSYDESNSTTNCSTSYPIGRLTRIVEAAVTTVYCYNARGDVIQKQQILGGAKDTTVYGLSTAGRLSTILYPSGTQVAYSRDKDGRIQTINVTPFGSTSSNTTVSNVTYQPFGPVSGYTLGNGQAISRTYDANYRLTDLTSPAFNLHVARDVMGDITAVGSTAGANPATETYSYDPLYRLIAVTEESGAVLESATYNATGDRLSKTGSGLDTGSYSYTPGTHHLTSIGNQVRSLDADGNTTSIAQSGGTYGFGYSDRNVLTVAQLAGTTVGTYTYNALKQRISKTGSSSVRYGYDEAQHLVGEYGLYTRDYVWMDDIPVAVVDVGVNSKSPSPTCFSCIPYSGGPVGSIPKSGTSGTTSTAINYVYSDGLGTPRAVANSAGTVIWQWAYQGNPWGEALPTSTGSYALNLRFSGQYYDAESGLAYNVNRSYEAATGRYIQSDPIGLDGGPSTYDYANQSPLVFSDFNGTQAYANGPLNKGDSTIYCDGLGSIAIWLIEQNPCWDDCVKEHEGVHRADALRSNASVCSNQPAGTQVYLGSIADTYKSEVRAHDQELDCLRKKLAALKTCDQCRKAIEDRISREENMKEGYENWLKTHFYE